jgi:hypothetical protein
LAALVTGALLALAIAPGFAWSDADPASDFLPGQDAFLPYGNGVAPGTAGQLQGLLKAARAHGSPFKVAVIGAPTDLGAVTALFDRPQLYATFLDREIGGLLADRRTTLVVIMPAGVGLAGPTATPAARRAVATIRPAVGATATQLAATAVAAVQRVAAADGVRLPRVGAAAGAALPGPPRGRRMFFWLVVAAIQAGIAGALWVRGLPLQPSGAR